MKNVTSDDDLRQRAAMDGRVAFAACALASAAGIVALLNRVGVPGPILGLLGPTLALAGLVGIGVLMRTMRISAFYAAGRLLPATYAGLSVAALAAGFFIPFLPRLGDRLPADAVLWGFGGGLALAALATGPFLRKTGAFSLTDLIAGRFPNALLRLFLALIVAAAAGTVALACFGASTQLLAPALGGDRFVAALVVALVMALVTLPGGLSGVVWSATGAAVLLLASLALPLAAMFWSGIPLPAPIVGDQAGWAAAADLMSTWNGGNGPAPGGAITIVAMALGIGTLAPLLLPWTACRKAGTARRAGLAGLGWAALIVILAATTMAVSSLALVAALEGVRPDQLPDFVYRAGAAHLVQICGRFVANPAAALGACAGQPRFAGTLAISDIRAGGAFLALAVPDLRAFGPAVAGLVHAGSVAASLVATAAALHGAATAIGNDALYRIRNRGALTSRRLAVTRAMLLCAIAAAAVATLSRPFDPRQLIGMALALSGTTLAPLLALSLWRRARPVDAAVTLFTSLALAEAVFALSATRPGIETLAQATVLGCCGGFLAGFATSLLRARDPTSAGDIFVERVLHGSSEVLNPDKGA